MRHSILALLVLALAACGGSGGGGAGGSSGPAPGPAVLTLSAVGPVPAIIVYSPTPVDSIDVTVKNTGGTGASASVKVYRDGVLVKSLFVPTLDPGVTWTGSYAIPPALYTGPLSTSIFTLKLTGAPDVVLDFEYHPYIVTGSAG